MPDNVPAKQKNPYTVAFAMFGELAFEIALPAVIFAMIGKRIDLAYGTAPKALIAGFVVAFLVSAVIVWKRAQAMKRMYLSDEL